MAVNIHITIIELNALHTKRQNLFQELDAVIDLLMEAKHWGLRKSRNATSLNSRFKSLDTLKVKIISVTFRRVIVPSFVSGAMAKAGKGLLEGTLQAGTSAVSDKLLDLVGLGGKSAADKGKDTRDYLAAAFPELN